ncbi:MAG: radical SAM protein [Candidatus Omnitrophota bacterium]
MKDLSRRLSARMLLKHQLTYLRGFYDYHIESSFRTLGPKHLLFAVTYKCNSRCRMCNIWKKKTQPEMPLDQINKVFSDKLFQSLEIISLTGGEPTLREDLPEIIELAVKKMPKLMKIIITTNGLNPLQIQEKCSKITRICSGKGLDFFVGISLDGMAATHNYIRNIPGAFDKVNQSIAKIKDIQKNSNLRYGINCTLTPENLYDAANLRQWAEKLGVYTKFIVACSTDQFYDNKALEDDLQFKGKNREFMLSFIKRMSEEKSLLNFSAYYYSDLINILGKGEARSLPCVFLLDGFMLDPYGELSYCLLADKIGNCLESSAWELYHRPGNLIKRGQLLKSKCYNCVSSCFVETAIVKDLFGYFKFLLSRQKRKSEIPLGKG